MSDARQPDKFPFNASWADVQKGISSWCAAVASDLGRIAQGAWDIVLGCLGHLGNPRLLFALLVKMLGSLLLAFLAWHIVAEGFRMAHPKFAAKIGLIRLFGGFTLR